MELDRLIEGKVVSSLGMIIETTGLIGNIVALTFTLDEVYKSTRQIIKTLQDQVEVVTDSLERQKINNVMNNIREIEPLNGRDFLI